MASFFEEESCMLKSAVLLDFTSRVFCYWFLLVCSSFNCNFSMTITLLGILSYCLKLTAHLT